MSASRLTKNDSAEKQEVINRQFLRIFLLFALFHLSTPTLAQVSAPLPIINLQIHDTHPGAIGTQLGQEVLRNFPNVQQQYDSYLTERFSKQAFDQIVKIQLPTMLALLDSRYSDEMYGVANAWALSKTGELGDGKLSLTEYQVLNLLNDLANAPDGSGFAVMSKASASSSPIVGRNLDWAKQTHLRQLQAITVYRDGDKGMVNIGFAGLVSVITGFNEQGLFAASMNAEPFSPYASNSNISPDFSLLSFDLRKALETRSSVKKAARLLAGKQYAYSHNILLADRESVQVLEQNAMRNKSLLRTWSSGLQYSNNKWPHRQQIAVVDCFLLPKNGNCNEPKDITRWQKFDALATFNAQSPANEHDIVNIMQNTDNSRYEIFNQNTLQSIIFQPKHTALRLYYKPPNGQHPEQPIYNDYPDLLPDVAAFNMQILVNAMIWGILIAMLGVVIWQIRRN